MFQYLPIYIGTTLSYEILIFFKLIFSLLLLLLLLVILSILKWSDSLTKSASVNFPFLIIKINYFRLLRNSSLRWKSRHFSSLSLFWCLFLQIKTGLCRAFFGITSFCFHTSSIIIPRFLTFSVVYFPLVWTIAEASLFIHFNCSKNPIINLF